MIVGFDYWQVTSHYPVQIGQLMWLMSQHAFVEDDFEVHVISAIGEGRRGTIKNDVYKSLSDGAGYRKPGLLVKPQNIHEVIFKSPKESPELKLAKCKELGITMFFDDRADVCALLNKNGILAMQVHRKDGSQYDLKSERK